MYTFICSLRVHSQRTKESTLLQDLSTCYITQQLVMKWLILVEYARQFFSCCYLVLFLILYDCILDIVMLDFVVSCFWSCSIHEKQTH